MEEPAAEGQPSIPSPFDLRTIKYLTTLMGRFDLTEIDLREGELRIRLRREAKRVVIDEVQAARPAKEPPATPVTPAASAAAPADQPAKLLLEIKSPTPGTFYASPKPDADYFVHVGSKVQPDTVVCIIEAMKVFNEIQAECTGTIVAILVENQQPVEYGQVLFKVDPAG
jgi:acetyl-CoA carboxylase biotin carboxyl carrier protein